jgi:HSP20 family protein
MVWAPPLEAFGRDGDLVIRADLAGVAMEDVDITLQDNVLTISGARKDAPEGVSHYLRELPYGEFRRTVAVPAGVEPDSIKARLENGILEVVLPGAVAEVQPKRIAIESGKESPQQVKG